VLADWKSVGGAQIAESLSFRIGDIEVAKLSYGRDRQSDDLATHLPA